MTGRRPNVSEVRGRNHCVRRLSEDSPQYEAPDRGFQRALLVEAGVNDIRAEQQSTKSDGLRGRYPMVTGIISTFGILFGFIALVFIVVNVAARM